MKRIFPTDKSGTSVFHYTPKALTRGAVIAAMYAALTILLAPISYGEIQVRISEIFTLLPIFFSEAVPGVTLGCFLANIFGGAMLPDILFGTLATLISAILTRRFREKFWLAAAMPVILNALIVGAVVHFCYAPAVPLPLCMLSVGAGEAVSCFLIGPILIRAFRRLPFLKS